VPQGQIIQVPRAALFLTTAAAGGPAHYPVAGPIPGAVEDVIVAREGRQKQKTARALATAMPGDPKVRARAVV
jgi:hypothetical protein